MCVYRLLSVCALNNFLNDKDRCSIYVSECMEIIKYVLSFYLRWRCQHLLLKFKKKLWDENFILSFMAFDI